MAEDRQYADSTGTPDLPQAAQIEAAQRSSARLMHDLAGSLQRAARALPARAGHSAARTAAALQSSARYVQNHGPRGMAADVSRVVRSYPGPALLAAVAAGYLVGRALRPRS